MEQTIKTLAVYTETTWAHGRIAEALKKYLKQYNWDVDIYDWNTTDETLLEKYDLIYCPFYGYTFKSEKLNKKTVYVIHGPSELQYVFPDEKGNITCKEITQEAVLYGNPEEEVLKLLRPKTLVGTVSSAISEKLRDEVNIITVENGVDSFLFNRIHKYPEKLTVVIPILDQELKSQYHDSKRLNLIHEVIGKLKDEDVVFKFIPKKLDLSEMNNFYNSGDILLSTSLDEGCSLSLLESMSCGLVPITTNTGTVNEIIQHGKNGYVLDNVVDDAVKYILELKSNQLLLRALQLEARNTVLTRWTWEDKIKKWNYFLNHNYNASLTTNLNKEKLRIHIYGLPHTLTVRDDPRMMTCAYTTKIWLLCKKLMDEGHEVIHYGVEGSIVPCTENVEYIPFELWERHNNNRAVESFHSHDPNSEIYRYAASRLPNEINKRIKDPSKEVVLASFGYWATELSDINKAALVEFGIGYYAVFTNYKVYESYSHMHTVYGVRREETDFKGWCDAVVPGYVDPEEFTFNETPQDYFAFLGRIIDTKGIYVVAQLAKNMGFKLKIAGNGDTSWITEDFKDIIEYIGVVGVKGKNELLRNAKATFCATHYVEPFANVHMESLMCGTPVIATDWGVYTETLPHGEVGYRVRTWEDYKYAVENIGKIDRRKCREWALSNWSLDAVYPKFNSYFKKCVGNFTEGSWYFEREDYDQYFSNYKKKYDEYKKVHIAMVLTDSHIEMGINCLKSYRELHDNYDITVIDCGINEGNKERLRNLKNFNKFIKNEGFKIPFAKAVYLKDVSDTGKILVIDADILFRKHIEDFLFFDDTSFVHVADDFATPQMQYDFNIGRYPENKTYFNSGYYKFFPELEKVKDETTYNCGLICIDMSNSKSKNFLNEFSRISVELNDVINEWPYEQGVFNYLLLGKEKSVKMFDHMYNSSAYPSSYSEKNDNLRVIHYHSLEELEKYKKVY